MSGGIKGVNQLLPAAFLVSFTMGDWKLRGQMDSLQEPKDLITVFDWGPSGGQVASFFPNSSMDM